MCNRSTDQVTFWITMISDRILFFVSVSLGLCLGPLSAKTFSTAQLQDIFSDGKTYSRTPGIAENHLETSFSGLDADERIQMIVDYLDEIEARDTPRYKLDSMRGNSVLRALRAHPAFITDTSLYRKYLREEEDPRRFYLLSHLSQGMGDSSKEDYITEKMRMLDRTGRAASGFEEEKPKWYGDISKWTYLSITWDLKLLGADFKEPDESLPHEEKITILKSYLNDHWLNREERKRHRSAQSGRKAGLAQSPSSSHDAELTSREPKPQWPIITAIILVVGALTIWWATRPQRQNKR